MVMITDNYIGGASWWKLPDQALSETALDNLISAHVLREGTDYGANEISFEQKKQTVLNCLKQGHAKIYYDSEENYCDLVFVQ